MNELRVEPPYADLLSRAGVADFDGAFACAAGERLDKPGLAPWRRRLRLTLTDGDGAPHVLYVKRYDRPPLRLQVRRILGGRPRESTAGREWSAIEQLERAHIPAPPRVAIGERMHGFLERQSVLMIGAVRGESLERWLPRGWNRRAVGAAWRRQQAWVRSLAEVVAAFHAAGFVHRDLYTSHVFLADTAPPGRDAFTLIDLQRVFRPRWRRTRWIVKDLAALDLSAAPIVSRTDRLRFWHAYVDAVGRPAWRERIAARVAARVRHVQQHLERRRERATLCASP